MIRSRHKRMSAAAVISLALALPAWTLGAAAKQVDLRAPQEQGFGIQAQPIQLVGADPTSYLTHDQAALAYILAKILPTGELLSSSGQMASTQTTAYTAVALALAGESGPAASLAQWLVSKQNADGGWGASLAAAAGSSTSDLRDSALALWAIAEVGHVGASTQSASHFSQIELGVKYLFSLQSTSNATFSDAGSTLAPAESNAIAIRALQVCAYAAQQLGHSNEAQQWLQASSQAAQALNADTGIARSVTTDFLASALWGLAPSTQAARRQVGATNDLGFAYLGFGAKSGPGYYSGMDWIDGVSTFNYAIAAARAGLQNLAIAQYNYGLTMQNSDGGFGTSAHPPMGPETGSFAKGPNASSVLVTAHYLLATHALLAHGMLGFGWNSANVTINGNASTIAAAPPALDPRIKMRHGPRIAVIIGSPSVQVNASQPATSGASEQNLQMNVAYELTQMGYRVTLFWYKPNQAQQFYPLNAFWASLGSFQDVIAANNSFAYSNGYKASFTAHQQQFLSWLQQGGRFIDAGDSGAVPLPSPLTVQVSGTPTPISAIRLSAGLAMENNPGGVGQGVSQNWPNAANAYYGVGSAYKVFAYGQTGSDQWQPVMVGAHYGLGRVLLSTVAVGSTAQDHAPLLSAMLGWANRGVQIPESVPVSYTGAAQQLYQAMQTVYAVSGTNLYREHNMPAQGDRSYSYLWPFGQAFAGIAASASALRPITDYPTLLNNLAAGLQMYNDPTSNPPGYDSYVLSQGGGLQYFDDNGWIALDLMRSYANTNNPQFLRLAESDFTFLQSGWSKSKIPPGGEYFNEKRIGRTQTATGSVIDAALRLYLATRNPLYLTFAKQAYNWDRTYIKGVNGLYNDGVTATGQANGTPYTYDTGVILQADVLLYRATNEAKYLTRAEQLATEGLSLYTDPLTGQMINNAGQSNAPFNEIFLRGLLMLYGEDQNPAYLSYIERQANTAYRYDRYANGIYGINWSGVNDPSQPVDLLTQGGTLRLFGMLANLQKTP